MFVSESISVIVYVLFFFVFSRKEIFMKLVKSKSNIKCNKVTKFKGSTPERLGDL